MIVSAIWASVPLGVMSASRLAAPPVSFMVGWPVGEVNHTHVAPEHAVLQPGSERLRAGFLGGEPLGIGGHPLGAALGFHLLHIGEDAVDELLAEALQRLLHAA